MDITNATGQDTKYTVIGGGGGSPMDPPRHREFRSEETTSWPMVHAGSRISCNPKSEGPWAVYFFVQGKAYSATAKSAGSHLTLLQNGGGFTVQVD